MIPICTSKIVLSHKSHLLYNRFFSYRKRKKKHNILKCNSCNGTNTWNFYKSSEGNAITIKELTVKSTYKLSFFLRVSYTVQLFIFIFFTYIITLFILKHYTLILSWSTYVYCWVGIIFGQLSIKVYFNTKGVIV